MKSKRQSIKLQVVLWEKLENLAIQTNSISLRGSKTGKPSWRVLIRRIANGELEVIKNE